MLCLIKNGTNYYEAVPQPVSVSECAYILAAPSDVTAGAFALSAADASVLASAVLGIWAVGAVFRIAISLMRDSSGEVNEQT